MKNKEKSSNTKLIYLDVLFISLDLYQCGAFLFFHLA